MTEYPVRGRVEAVTEKYGGGIRVGGEWFNFEEKNPALPARGLLVRFRAYDKPKKNGHGVARIVVSGTLQRATVATDATEATGESPPLREQQKQRMQQEQRERALAREAIDYAKVVERAIEAADLLVTGCEDAPPAVFAQKRAEARIAAFAAIAAEERMKRVQAEKEKNIARVERGR